MDIVAVGTGGANGWPDPTCRCASCQRVRITAAPARGRSAIVVDDALLLGLDGVREATEDDPGEWNSGAKRKSGVEKRPPKFRVAPIFHANSGGGGRGDDPEGGGGRGDDPEGGGGREDDPEGGAGAVEGGTARADEAWTSGSGHVVARIPGGWDVTGPDGGRLVYPDGPGSVLEPPEGACAYDVAFVDVLGDPFQLGRLRARGLVTEHTTTIAAFADHRVSSAAELERLCAVWRVAVLDDADRVTERRYDNEKIFRVLVLGGARSGKSERAELRVAGEPAVTYVATGPSGAGDPDWAARVAAHRARRPAWWRTVETTDLARVLTTTTGAVLIDGMGTWLAAVLDENGWDTSGLDARIAELVQAWRRTEAYVVAVSDETGLGIIPETPAGRVFRDWLGRVNQALAAESEETELVVAGQVLTFGW